MIAGSCMVTFATIFLTSGAIKTGDGFGLTGVAGLLSVG